MAIRIVITKFTSWQVLGTVENVGGKGEWWDGENYMHSTGLDGKILPLVNVH